MGVDYEAGSPAGPRPGLGPYRVGDYLALPEEPRCELLFGRLFVTPAPTVRHQRVLLKLARHLDDLASLTGGLALPAPVDVVLAEHSIVQPDVVYVGPHRLAIVGDRIDGAPDLAIEVLSPTSGRQDLGEKLRLYAESGVPEYWLVDPQAKTIEFRRLRDGLYVPEPASRGRYRSRVTAGLELDLEAFWRSIPD